MSDRRATKKKQTAFREAVEFQQMLLSAARASSPACSAIAQAARAWCECEERKRILSGRPKPKDIDLKDLLQLKAMSKAPKGKLLSFAESNSSETKSQLPPSTETPTPIDVDSQRVA